MRNLIWTLTPWRFRLAGRIRQTLRWTADRNPEAAELLAAAGFHERC